MAEYSSDSTTVKTEPAASVQPAVVYAGFWIRFLASVLDTILLLLIMVPLSLVLFGPGVLLAQESPGPLYDLINYLLPIVAVIIFWQYRSATPGKMMMGISIVDAQSLGKPSFGSLLLRYLGYYLSILPIFLGFIWVAFDKREQGFHDKIAKTVVIKNESMAVSVSEQTESELASAVEKPAVTKSPTQDPWKE